MEITSISLGPKYSDKQRMMAALARANFKPGEVVRGCDPELIERVRPEALSAIDQKVKSGGNLSFEQAFSGMAFVLAATNNLLRGQLFPGMDLPEAIAKGTAFLQLMAVKEALAGLSAEEVAGMVAATSLDIVFRPEFRQVTETCGMGGDRGWETREVKTISASTLSALVLASLGFTAFKHGSFGNTTAVGSTDVPINFGANICQYSASDIQLLLARARFWFSDAHSVKTIHYLSHLLMVETVNHVLGPMTLPIARQTQLFKVMGVNHHVHPDVIARAYTILHKRGFVNLGGVIAVAGLDECPLHGEHRKSGWIAAHTFLDEVSPRATLVSLARRDEFMGSFLLADVHFGAGPLNEERLRVPNTIPDLMKANQAALAGLDPDLSPYLARNAALALLVSEGLEDGPLTRLPECYRRCLEAINSGQALQALERYVEVSGGRFHSWL